ncbi:alanine racemase [Blastococcus sp. TML/M2B]|uniref:alanine racemase n=1 Tax=unclassified Blastococcus TaxID=2619396 RepID=UPI001909F333|nr:MULTISPECIES: alanine racemase [unclassified Blastococcus]MBN1093941.1 alanine racemase [Blastococcus sp. TML/M2B]MBN1095943.1 alanine racemase [Blastococcus sp. TML/C7B]
MTTQPGAGRAEVVVDLDAIAANTAVLRERVGRPLMAVVKADGYGHGLVPAARAVLAGGADALGVAVVPEALALRAAGVTAPVLAWLNGPGTDVAAALRGDVELSVSAGWGLDEVVAAARAEGRTARVHLAIDTGLSREGATPADWPALVAAAVRAQADGDVTVAGLWSHMAYADAPTHPTIGAQVRVFEEATTLARDAGLTDARRHLANSAATIALPGTWFDVVRPGIALYGLDPLGGDPRAHGLRPAMTVRAQVAHTKRVPAGAGVSYGHTYTTERETTLALVPVGYADGIPRAVGNRAPVLAAGAQRRIAGRVCMDQFVLDVGDDVIAPGDDVVLWGPGDDGEPTAQQWADAADSIHYELVTRVGGRFPRRYVGTAGAV